MTELYDWYIHRRDHSGGWVIHRRLTGTHGAGHLDAAITPADLAAAKLEHFTTPDPTLRAGVWEHGVAGGKPLAIATWNTDGTIHVEAAAAEQGAAK